MEETIDERSSLYYGAVMSVDNINYIQKTETYSSVDQHKIMNMTSTAFVFNRIPQPISEALSNPKFEKAVDVPSSAVLPTSEDLEIMKEDHKRIVRRILVQNVEEFGDLKNLVQWSTPHKFSQLSKQKSEFISLGVQDIDESTTSGTVKILENMIPYLPRDGENVLGVAVGADTLTADLIRSVQDHRCNSTTPEELLDHATPLVGAFHLRMALVQDAVTHFFGRKKDGTTKKAGKGSIPYIRARFGHPSVSFIMSLIQHE